MCKSSEEVERTSGVEVEELEEGDGAREKGWWKE
jgi:hypothetical protein